MKTEELHWQAIFLDIDLLTPDDREEVLGGGRYEISPILTLIFNDSLARGDVPDD